MRGDREGVCGGFVVSVRDFESGVGWWERCRYLSVGGVVIGVKFRGYLGLHGAGLALLCIQVLVSGFCIACVRSSGAESGAGW